MWYDEETCEWKKHGTSPIKNAYFKLIPDDQPERSKREDTIYTTDLVVAMASMRKAMPNFNYVVKEDGSLEKVMRCSEHGGNAVRDK
jgi:hypothetical protein